MDIKQFNDNSAIGPHYSNEQQSLSTDFGNCPINTDGPTNIFQGNATNVYFPQSSAVQEEIRCCQLLKTSDYELHKDIIPKRHPATCRWALDDAAFEKWRDDSTTGHILWVTADPGCGKSVFVKSVIDEGLLNSKLSSQSPREVPKTICYFFFKRGVQEQDSLANALCAILHQLVTNQPQLRKDVVAAWEQVGERLITECSTLRRVLRQACRDTTARPIVCIFDALDECQRKDHEVLIQMLSEWQRDLPRVKLLMTSRPFGNLGSLVSIANSMEAVRIQGENHNAELLKEVDVVVNSEINEWVTSTMLAPNEVDELRASLSRLNQRTYLWWQLAKKDVRELCHVRTDIDSSTLSLLINRIPKNVDTAYRRMIMNIPKLAMQTARQLFSIMLVRREPLKLSEVVRMSTLVKLCGCGGFPSTILDEDQAHELIRRCCGSFVYVHDSKLHFFHATARDFLRRYFVKDPSNYDGKTDGTSALTRAHVLLANVSYMAVQIHMAAMNVQQTGDEIQHDPLLTYAMSHGPQHVIQAIQTADQNTGQTMVKQLHGYGMDLKSLDKTGKSVLHHLVGSSFAHADIYDHVKSVIEAGGLVTSATKDNMHALQLAIYRGRPRLVSLLLENGFPINEAVVRSVDSSNDSTGDDVVHYGPSIVKLTALHAAIIFGDASMLSQLFEAGATVESSLASRSALLRAAIRCGPPPTSYQRLQTWDTTNFRADVQTKHPAILTMLCKHLPEFTRWQDYEDRTALHLVEYRLDRRHIPGAWLCAKPELLLPVLLKYGADPNVKDIYQDTPLHLSAKAGNSICFKLLLPYMEQGSVHKKNKQGQTVVHLAAQSGDGKCLRLALRRAHPDDMNAVNDLGQTFLHCAALSGQSKCVAYALAELDTALWQLTDNEGQTFVHCAARTGDYECLKLAVEAAGIAALWQKNSHGRSCLHHVACSFDPSGIAYVLGILDDGFLINALDTEEHTPLQLALNKMAEGFQVSQGRPSNSALKSLDLLLQAGAKVGKDNLPNEHALTQYFKALSVIISPAVVERLLRCDAPIDNIENGWNLAHLLVQRRNNNIEQHVLVLRMLHTSGVLLSAVDNDQRTILHLAAINGSITTDLISYMNDMVDVWAQDRLSMTALQYAEEYKSSADMSLKYLLVRLDSSIALLRSMSGQKHEK